MDADKTPCPVAEAAAGSKDEEEPFTEVKRPARKRKREKRADMMDTEDSVNSKRPHFPPISSDKLQVKTLCVSVFIHYYSVVMYFIHCQDFISFALCSFNRYCFFTLRMRSKDMRPDSWRKSMFMFYFTNHLRLICSYITVSIRN